MKTAIQPLEKELSSDFYYTAPADEHFTEVKNAAIEIWESYDDTYGYASGKIGHIVDLKNKGDNFMYIVNMFDIWNQKKLSDLISEETSAEIRSRLIAGGALEEFIVF